MDTIPAGSSASWHDLGLSNLCQLSQGHGTKDTSQLYSYVQIPAITTADR